MVRSRQKGTGSHQLFDGIPQGDSVVLNKWLVDTALERDEADSFHPTRLREMRRGLILTVIVSAGGWALVIYIARIVFQ